MNEPSLLNDDNHRFDRLVDGELSPEEYRALIASFDDEPGAWRRCALAFLEAQALTGELGRVRGAYDLADRPSIKHASPRAAHGFPLTFLAVAASFLLAFGLGVYAPRFFNDGVQETPLAGNVSLPGAHQEPAQPRHESLKPIGNVRLVMDGSTSDGAQSGELPVYEGEDLDQLLRQQAPALAPELVDLLRQRGHSVEQQRQLVPVQLEDGRQLVVPIEGYQIIPVRNRSY